MAIDVAPALAQSVQVERPVAVERPERPERRVRRSGRIAPNGAIGPNGARVEIGPSVPKDGIDRNGASASSGPRSRSVLSGGTRLMKRHVHVLWALLILFCVPGVSSADEEHWQVGTMPSFSTGKYGTDTRTEILHTPVLARRLFDAGELTLVFPFICIKGIGNVTVISGAPVRTEPTGTQPARGQTDRSGGSERATRAAAHRNRRECKGNHSLRRRRSRRARTILSDRRTWVDADDCDPRARQSTNRERRGWPRHRPAG